MLTACTMHWYVSALYVAPVLFVGGFLKFSSWRGPTGGRDRQPRERLDLRSTGADDDL